MTADMECGGENNRSYEYLIRAFDENKIKNRYCLLEESAKKFIESKKLQKYVHVNSFLVREIILDYFSDIQRLKNFHEIEKTNPLKVAAYTAFWICRRKPLYVVAETVDEDTIKKHPELNDINEWLAVFVMITYAFDKKHPLFLNLMELKSFRNFSTHLRYFLIYRIFTAQSLELALVGFVSTCMYTPIVDPASIPV